MPWLDLEAELKEEFASIQQRELDKFLDNYAPNKKYYFKYRDIIRSERMRRYYNEDQVTRKRNIALKRARLMRMTPQDRARARSKPWKPHLLKTLSRSQRVYYRLSRVKRRELNRKRNAKKKAYRLWSAEKKTKHAQNVKAWRSRLTPEQKKRYNSRAHYTEEQKSIRRAKEKNWSIARMKQKTCTEIIQC